MAQLLALACWLLPAVAPAAAAEVLQVRSGQLLQIGDQNRSYSVALACIAIPAGGDQAAAAWLRQELPRRTRVNLRPLGSEQGTLLAQVQRLPSGRSDSPTDLGAGLVAAGLAEPLPHCSD
jgi:hypothetical protein